MTNKIGQMVIVKRATSMTGANEVIADAAFGLLSNHALSGGKNPAILDKDVKAQSNETGKI